MSPAVLQAVRRGFSVTYKNKTLLSKIDPVGQAERITAGLPRQDRTLYFCPSPLFGYGLSSLLNSLGSGSAVLCVETDPVLMDLSRRGLPQPSRPETPPEAPFDHPRCVLTDIADPARLCLFARETWGSRSFRRVVPVKLSGGWQLDEDRYDALLEALRGDIAVDWGNAMTLVKLGRRYVRNAIRNLPLLAGKSSDINDLYGSRPILVLGAGPSLDGFLDSLETRLTGSVPRPFGIICVDTAVSALLERNLIPDLAVILESQHWNLWDFTGARNSGIAAAFDLSACPATADILGGKLFLFFTPWTTLRLFDRLEAAGFGTLPSLLPLGSVGLTAVELARRLGSGPVIIAGIDFSFTPELLHARSTPGHLAALTGLNRLRSLINSDAVFRRGVFRTGSKSGASVFSNPSMRNYRNLFEQEFSGDPRLYDVEGTGLDLGLRILDRETAFRMLFAVPSAGTIPPSGTIPLAGTIPAGSGTQRAALKPAPQEREMRERLAAFIDGETTLLEELRKILTGNAGGNSRLPPLLDETDYLWAHFPDCAGTEGRRPPETDLAFLKRVRAEIDPFLKLWRLSAREIWR